MVIPTYYGLDFCFRWGLIKDLNELLK